MRATTIKESKLLQARRRRRQVQTVVGIGGAVAIVALFVSVVLLAPSGTPTNPPSTASCPTDFATNRCAVIVTASGIIVFEIEETYMPRSSSHFIALMQSGYYTGLPWHRVEGFVIQTGQGSPTGTVDLELNPNMSNVRGGVGVARTSDPNSGSSQFYILKQDSTGLDTSGGGYAVFGRVKVGMSVVDAVTVNEIITSVTIVNQYP